MRKLVIYIAVAALAVSLVILAIACGGKETTTTTTNNTPPPTTQTATTIPHIITGQDQCLVCHQTGVGGAKVVPADHAGRTNSSCTSSGCHKVSSTATKVPITATAIPHSLDGRDQCLVCHQTGVGGATVVPADHAGRGNTTCSMCHKVSTTTTPTTPTATPIPHSLDGRDQCLVCHQTGLTGAKAVPSDHAGRTNSTCTTCHKVQ